jgi:hypothetical protein
MAGERFPIAAEKPCDACGRNPYVREWRAVRQTRRLTPVLSLRTLGHLSATSSRRFILQAEPHGLKGLPSVHPRAADQSASPRGSWFC